jgi:hypothetical protein
MSQNIPTNSEARRIQNCMLGSCKALTWQLFSLFQMRVYRHDFTHMMKVKLLFILSEVGIGLDRRTLFDGIGVLPQADF